MLMCYYYCCCPLLTRTAAQPVTERFSNSSIAVESARVVSTPEDVQVHDKTYSVTAAYMYEYTYIYVHTLVLLIAY
jgi:hypothetical protein